ncbi:MAG: hypothetical protein HGA67_01515 [Candidatus Yonathbacteria bacterium]|nr:hypothetical protein [Candidatus Yonathbacteria bacterium]
MKKLVPITSDVTLVELMKKERAYKELANQLGLKIAIKASDEEISSLRTQFSQAENEFLEYRNEFKEIDVSDVPRGGDCGGQVPPLPTLDERDSQRDWGGHYRGRYGYSEDYNLDTE